MVFRSISAGAKEFIKKWFYFSGNCDRETWWRSLALSIVGIYFSIRVYFSGLSFWLKRPDPYFTTISAIIFCASIWIVVSSATRRSRSLSLPGRFHWLIIIAPVWVILLGTMSNSDKDERKGKFYKYITSSRGIKSVFFISALFVFSFYFLPTTKYEFATKNGNTSSLPTTRECIELGIDYYKEIGSYPVLSSGKDAKSEVNERCRRSALAFGRP